MDGNGALRTCFMAPDNIVGYPDIFVQNRSGIRWSISPA